MSGFTHDVYREVLRMVDGAVNLLVANANGNAHAHAHANQSNAEAERESSLNSEKLNSGALLAHWRLLVREFATVLGFTQGEQRNEVGERLRKA